MVIYEVNLTIDTDIYSEFCLWLREHMHQMLQFPGFIQASLLKPEENDLANQEKLTVQYQLDTRENLEKYFAEFATSMRNEGLQRFNDKFGATRKIFEVKEVILK